MVELFFAEFWTQSRAFTYVNAKPTREGIFWPPNLSMTLQSSWRSSFSSSDRRIWRRGSSSVRPDALRRVALTRRGPLTVSNFLRDISCLFCLEHRRTVRWHFSSRRQSHWDKLFLVTDRAYYILGHVIRIVFRFSVSTVSFCTKQESTVPISSCLAHTLLRLPLRPSRLQDAAIIIESMVTNLANDVAQES